VECGAPAPELAIWQGGRQIGEKRKRGREQKRKKTTTGVQEHKFFGSHFVLTLKIYFLESDLCQCFTPVFGTNTRVTLRVVAAPFIEAKDFEKLAEKPRI
jgi:hypothetical protein